MASAAFSLAVVTLATAKLVLVIFREGVASLSLMVSVPVASEIVALAGLDSVSVAVSLASSKVSARTPTVKVVDVEPALIVAATQPYKQPDPNALFPHLQS